MTPKKLVLCSDGTGNSSAKAEKTNVWRMFQALDQTLPDQLAKYDDGVGTSSIKLLAILGGAFGYGLKRNVIDLYKFVCRNYVPGDEIHGFGFSRGAFTIRVVAALIESQGLVEGRSEEELHARAVVAYRRYRNERYPSWSPLVFLGRRLRDAALWLSTRAARDHLRKLPKGRRAGEVLIRFLGLWDTVAAYGMPVDELKWGISLLVWPMAAIDHHLGVHVQRACHALSLDDPRQTFHPVLFDEVEEARLVQAGTVPPGRLTQVWFAGAHSNVGGGYPEDQQSLVTLDWMMSQALAVGLRLDASAVRATAETKSSYARLYDPRRGLAAYYRYAPRHVDMTADDDRHPLRAILRRHAVIQAIRPIVHGSVVMRLAEGSDAYAPITLPAHFDVLAPDGTLIPMAGFAAAAARVHRPVSTTAAAAVVASKTAALHQAIAAIGAPNLPLVEQVRDTVWWRRVTYFVCLGFTLALVAFPRAAPVYADGVGATMARFGPDLARDAQAASAWLDGTLHGVIAGGVDAARSMAPHWSGPWLDALAKQPFEMIVALLLVALPFFAGDFLGLRIHDRAWFAWHPARLDDYITWVRTSAVRSRAIAAALLAAGVALLVAGRLGHWRPEVVGLLRPLVLLLGLAFAWRVGIVLHLRKLRAGVIPNTPTLIVARKLRTSIPVELLAAAMARYVVPLVFALALLWGIVGVASHFVMRAADSANVAAPCHPTPHPRVVQDDGATASGQFKLTSMCWASGLAVVKDHRYAVTFDASGADWFDKETAASVAGIEHLTLPHVVAAPILRTWSAGWFVPLLRIDTIGNDEQVIPADGPQSARPALGHLTFTADRDGEVFLYVNDAVGVPPFDNYFYSNNNDRGHPAAGGADATLKICDITAKSACGCAPEAASAAAARCEASVAAPLAPASAAH